MILYRNSVQGVLNYVLGKTESTILGFQNTYADTDTNTKFLEGCSTIWAIGTIRKDDM
ncbi:MULTISPECIES: hypothetical protein [Arenibacter]|uniref:hypothetical protein n=1 Tax=Arenibacter TaxID=178469 RepID=UPI0012FFDFEA|nr:MULTISPECIES: hypothetical protein [Arenibacter]